MNDKKPVYITTTLPYVNAKPHVGHALEFVRADALARYFALSGHEVFLNTGTDEHGIKIYQKAQAEGEDVQVYVDRHAKNFRELTRLLNMAVDVPGVTFNFIRTTDKKHIEAAEAFWKLCDKHGFIEKRTYTGLYCVNDELFIPEKDLVNGECPNHPGQKLVEISEENYFFKASAFSKTLLLQYEKTPDFIVPVSRMNEMKALLSRGLEDFSISRVKEKMPWGIPVPGDETQVMYVWFDALVNYIAAVGWPNDLEKFQKWWPVIQYCGKDNTRQQSAMWQSMLLAAGLPLSKQIIVNGFVTAEGGVKMSKSLGNVIDPVEIINEYGADAFRYYVLREIHPFEDSPFTKEKFKETYNANLANGLGNLASRIMKMAEDNLHDANPRMKTNDTRKFPKEYHDAFEERNLQKAANIVWQKIGEMDLRIQEEKPFSLVKTDPEKAKKIIQELVSDLHVVADMLAPLLPETSEKIKLAIKQNKKPETLFARK